ncbi:MAG TPA: AAA family ATPase [Polyangia bacterium]|nr:AAA family ATPase [Polyangia bacterium]
MSRSASRGEGAREGAAAEIRLLGELEVRRQGRALPLPASKKTRALLAYLVATGRPHLRESLCALLWDGPDDPRAELRWSLTKLRPLLDGGGGQLQTDRERAGFVAGPVRVDAVAVRALVGRAASEATLDALRAAAGQFRGEPLEGLDLPACFRYHEWYVGEREALRGLRGTVLAELAARLGAADRPTADLDEALRWARLRVASDPLTEACHVDVVRILGRLGRAREALAQYDACRRILQTELGARVSDALEQARRELGAARPGREIAVAAPAHGEPAREAAGSPGQERPPLVGRDSARAAVEAAVASARAGVPSPVLLFVGDPGIGKTRLLDLVADEVRAAGGAVLRGRAFEAEMVRPYGAWSDALAGARLPPDVALGPDPLLHLAPLLSGAGAPPGGVADRGQLYEAVARLLAEAAPGGPLAVVLDDIQWLDEASAALLHFLARAPLGGRTLLACAARAGELGDNSATLRVVRALDRERRLVQHRLEPLGPAETAALVAAINPTADGAEAFASSEGNPLYALEIARAAAAGAPTANESLNGLLDERLERLGEGARDLLPWAAALGRSFDPEVLALVRGTTAADLIGRLEELERHGIIRAASATHYDFAHDLLRQAAYRRLSEPRRRLVHLQVARALQAARGDDALAGEVAHHAGLGGDAKLAAQAAVAAGQRCLRLYAHADAAELANRGLQHAARLDRVDRVPLQIGLYGVLVGSGRVAQGSSPIEAGLSRAIVEAQELGLHAAAAEGFHVRSVMHYFGSDFEAAHASTIRVAEETRDLDPLVRGRALADSARCLMLLESDVARAQALIAEARAALGPRADQVANVAWATGLLARYLGDSAVAAPAFEAAIGGFTREAAHWERCQALAQRVMLQLEGGTADSARADCGTLAEVAEKMGDGSEPAVAGALAALVARAMGEEGATDQLERAIAALVAVDAKAMLGYVLNVAATQDLASADLGSTEARAARALAAATAVGRRSEIAIARSLLGRAALARGDRAAALDHLSAVGDDRRASLGLSARAAAAVDALAAAIARGAGANLT